MNKHHHDSKNKQPVEKTLLSRRGLSIRWDLHPISLRRKEKAGTLPFLKLGRLVRYRLSDIERIEAEAAVSL